jgi:hypothetical protein
MHDFVKGWKRKVGVVTLVMACVLTAAWVRSLTVMDTVWIPARGDEAFCCLSTSGYLSCDLLAGFKEPPFASWDSELISAFRPIEFPMFPNDSPPKPTDY